MPRPAGDALLTCTVTPTLTRREEHLETVRQRIADGAVLWDVSVSEFSQRLMALPDDWPQPGDKAPRPDPYIEADFTVLQHDGQLTVVSWSVTGSEIVSTRKSRIPLQAYANAALTAVEDALEANPGRSYEQMTVQRRGHVSAFEMSKGRLVDRDTREQRKPSRRRYAAATNGNQPTLELARVVDEYRAAVERGSRSPTVDVAHAFNVGRSTAARALAEAREQGLLGPALRNRAGEQH